MIYEVLIETVKRVAMIAAVIFPVLFLVEFLNHKYGERLVDFFEKRKRFLPFWAAVFSLLPGCNAAAVVAVLYVKRLVSMGALVAAMLATSDEAIYVFLPSKFNFLPLFLAKLLLAVIVGFAVDLIINFSEKKGITNLNVGYCCSIHEHHHDIWGMLKHTLEHGVRIILFIFIVLLSFNLIKDFYGFDQTAAMVLRTGRLQPLLAGLFGLIPGCGTSVVLATLYTQKILSFGGALAGLSAASGDTLLVLVSNKISKKEILTLLGIVFFASVVGGYVVTLF